MKEVNITYESLFELLRREKNREELQQLDPQFYSDVSAYLEEKRRSMAQNPSEMSRSAKQIENVHRIVRDLYERREKKITNMALNKSRTGSNIIDTSTLLEKEKELFDTIVSKLNSFKKDMLLNALEKEEIKPVQKPETKTEAPASRRVQFIHAVPKFVGKELESYGPFEPGDEAKLPSQIADVLIKKGRAKEM